MTHSDDTRCCEVERADTELAEATPQSTRTASPRQAVQRTGSGYELLLELPGVDPAAIALDLSGRTLTLRAEVTELPALEDATQSFCEFEALPYEARWTLPREVDAEAITTRHASGLLTVVLPEARPAARTIPVIES